MPRYFFHVHDGQRLEDNEGTELESWRAAQLEAIRCAGMLIADTAQGMKLGEDWRMEVVDETGLILFILNFHVSSSAATLGSAGTANA